MTPQQRAAKTRAQNQANERLYYEITKPAHEKVEKILNGFLAKMTSQSIRLKWVGKWRLKHGVTGARLLKIESGGLGFWVQIDGYKTIKRYSSKFWEVAK
jgi:hypothetical protein